MATWKLYAIPQLLPLRGPLSKVDAIKRHGTGHRAGRSLTVEDKRSRIIGSVDPDPIGTTTSRDGKNSVRCSQRAAQNVIVRGGKIGLSRRDTLLGLNGHQP